MGFLAVLVYVLLSFFVGATLIGLSLDTIDLNLVLRYIEKQILPDFFLRSVLFITGILIILFCIRYIQKILYRRERSIVSQSQYGKVSITLFAVEDMLKNMLETEKGFSHVRPRVIATKRGTDVIIRGNLNSEVNFPTFTEEVQGKVKEKLQNLLGEEKEIKVKIEIRKMVFKGNKKIVEEQKEPEIPYRYY
jgi:hypothetical protein